MNPSDLPAASMDATNLPPNMARWAWAWRDLNGQPKEHSPRRPIRTITASANVNPLDQIIVVSASATVTLETAVAADNRWHVIVFTGTSGSLTVACTGSETISGASSVSTSMQYGSFIVWSDGTNWHAISGSRSLIDAAFNNRPLMSYGGMAFNGSTNYLDGNALTGIADSKVGTFVAWVRFAGAASTIENIIASSGGAFVVQRTAAGKITCFAENAAGTTILDIITSDAVASAAGTYCIQVEFNLVSGARKIFVNDVDCALTINTFTNDTIDYTVAEYAIGGSAAGANLFTGDLYLVYLDATDNILFSSESLRRRFINADGEPMYLGANGEMANFTTGTPILFLAYDDSASWDANRGSATTTFTRNGTFADAATRLLGQYASLEDYAQGITVTASYTVQRTDRLVINNRAATNTLTLPNAALNKGRQLHITTIQAQTVVSASSNVVPIAGGAAGTAILAATAGAWALLEAKGANWQIIAS